MVGTGTGMSPNTEGSLAMSGACYRCIYRREVPGDCHSRCAHPAVEERLGNSRLRSVSEMFILLGGSVTMTFPGIDVEGHPHGIARGWFSWPLNFDPTWLRKCSGFTAAKANS